MTEQIRDFSTAMSAQNVRVVSNSEVQTWNTCQRSYYYQYSMGLTPAAKATYFRRGTYGHNYLQKFFETMQNNPLDFDLAKQKAEYTLIVAMQDNMLDVEMIGTLRTVLNRYVDRLRERFESGAWRVLSVEEVFELPLTNDFSFGFKPDLVLWIQDKGVVLVDHKIVYDFWSQAELDLDPQTRKYMAALRANGKQVDGIMMNQIRYRLLKTRLQSDDELFRESFYFPSPVELREIMREQIIASREILNFRSQSKDIQNATARRVLKKTICEWCPVFDLCYTELRGGFIDTLVEVDYKKNDYAYAYNKEE